MTSGCRRQRHALYQLRMGRCIDEDECPPLTDCDAIAVEWKIGGSAAFELGVFGRGVGVTVESFERRSSYHACMGLEHVGMRLLV